MAFLRPKYHFLAHILKKIHNFLPISLTNGFVPDSHNGYPKITPVSQPGRLLGLI